MRAILIDDEPLALDYLEHQLLSIEGLRVIGKYTDPFEGKLAVEQSEAEIVFLDIHIPDMDGLELAEQLLENRPEFMACNTDEMFDAVEDLVGEGRLEEGRIPNYHFGTIPVNFADGADRPWTVPKKGWHYDGSFFQHHVNSREQGLLVLVLFNDIVKHGGGTLAVEGSHHVVANMLNQHPDGLSFADANKAAFAANPWLQELCGTSADDYSKKSGPKAYSYSSVWDDDPEKDPEGLRVEKFMNQTYETPEGYKLRVIETMGQAGDCFFLHPFMIHAASQNHSGNPRFIGNRKNTLSESLQLERENPEEYSPVELAIRQALYGAEKA